jgi:cytoskeletal protein CcmA (bactofilin family)
VELHSSARLYGNLSTPLLSIAEGVIFEGSCTMGKKDEKAETHPLKGTMPEPAEKILSK